MLLLSPEVPVYDDVYQRLLQRLPNSASYTVAPVTLPFSVNPTRFILTTDQFGLPPNATPHVIRINGQRVTAVVPTRAKTRVELQLPYGPAEIIVDNGVDDLFVLQVLTKHEATFFSGAARETFLHAQRIIDENEEALASPFNSRLAEHHLLFQDLLPAQRSPRTHAVKLAIRQMVANFGTKRGVRDFISALLYSTPVLNEMAGEGQRLDPGVYPIIRQGQDFSGVELHVWLPNLCAITWVAFTRLIDNVRGRGIQLTDVTENQVTLEVNGRQQVHRFPLDDDRCVDAIQDLVACFDGVRVYLETHARADMAFCADAYPFDLVVADPLGVPRFDEALPADGGTLFDQFNTFDPSGPEFTGTSLTDRFDGGRCLDTFGTAGRQATLDCCYSGAAVTGQLHNGFDVTIDGRFPLGT